MPLRILSLSAEDAIIGEGITEDLVEMLSRLPSVFVISRLSTRALRDALLHPTQIGARLGVRYVLCGSLRASGDTLRLSAELTDTGVGGVLWSRNFDERRTDILAMQDRLSHQVARSVAPTLHQSEIRRIRPMRSEDLHAFELLLRGIDLMHNSSMAEFETAGTSFAEAVERDPMFANAHAWRSYWHLLRVGQGWSRDRAQDTAEADRHAETALRLGPSEPLVLAVGGHVSSYLHRDFDEAFRRFDRALSINPNSAPAWMWSGLTNGWIDQGRIGVEQVERALALTPCDPLLYAYFSTAGVVSLVAGDYERAVEFSRRCLDENRTFTSAYRVIAIAQSLAGQQAEARATVERLLSLEPSLTVAGFRHRYPGNASGYCARWCEALAAAGVPEGKPP